MDAEEKLEQMKSGKWTPFDWVTDNLLLDEFPCDTVALVSLGKSIEATWVEQVMISRPGRVGTRNSYLSFMSGCEHNQLDVVAILVPGMPNAQIIDDAFPQKKGVIMAYRKEIVWCGQLTDDMYLAIQSDCAPFTIVDDRIELFRPTPCDNAEQQVFVAKGPIVQFPRYQLLTVEISFKRFMSKR